MKKTLSILFVIVGLSSCTEEVTIDEVLNPTDVKLVIDANMDIEKGSTSATSTQVIRISKTSSFYTPVFQGITGAQITMEDQNGNSVGTFLDINPAIPNDVADGVYTAVDFVNPNPNADEVDRTYTLTITVEGNTYQATETLFTIENINGITQDVFEAVDGFLEINVNIDNEIGAENYYLLEYQNSKHQIYEYDAQNDQFFSEEVGKNNFDFIYTDELKTDDTIDIKVFGVSQSYFNYMNKLITISQGGGNGPFATAPSTVRGNFTNTTNLEAFTLGYFSINQFVETSYTVE